MVVQHHEARAAISSSGLMRLVVEGEEVILLEVITEKQQPVHNSPSE